MSSVLPPSTQIHLNFTSPQARWLQKLMLLARKPASSVIILTRAETMPIIRLGVFDPLATYCVTSLMTGAAYGKCRRQHRFATALVLG
jgi:hypothetical protein